MKIVITGGLGYIGTELCKLYSGEARFKDITVIDKKFISGRVKQLRDWGIDFKQGNILDKDFMTDVLKDVDIVYHLSGITDVAYTKTESNEEKDKEISEVGIQGSRNIINLSPEDCKIIFPSTHVVYEGFDETAFDLTEEVETCPVLTYSLGKVTTETDLEMSNKNYVVVRLASVYGYSSDTMRINIMPNLFSKMTSQNSTIKLFSGGVQHKSLVSVFDVVRCLKFVGENENINKEFFHCSNENMTVKEVAKLCKEINPNIELIETNDEIPNLGYTISNEKLLSTGFEFRYNIKESMKEMIENWSEKELITDLEFLQRGDKEYVDDRGKISNYELTEPINLIGYIESKAGTVRANHYHPIQEQKCLLIKGKYISVIKDLSNPDSVIETNIVNAGDLSVIKPNVAHTMVFLEDSIFLNLVRGEREHENYGITHTIFHELVDEKLRKFIVDNYKAECRSCGNERLKNVVSLGMSPLANNLLEDENQEDELFPLEMNYCPECHNCQLSVVVPPERMFDNYLYVSSTSLEFRKHFADMADSFIKEFDLDENSLVVDIGSNDGVFLKPIKDKGIKILGIDPAKNVCEIANKTGIETMEGYFNDDMADEIIKQKGKADLVTGFNVFAHSDKLKEITRNAFKLLKANGIFVIEVQYLLDTIKDLTFDNIYHEHVNFWSVTSLNNFFDILGYTIYKVEHVDTHGGSIRVYVGNDTNKQSDSVSKFLQKEKDFGLLDFNTYKKFAKRIEDCKDIVVNKLKEIKGSNKNIVGYGSPAKATTVLNYYGVSSDYIDYIIEDNELKHNHLLPGMRIPIKEKNVIKTNLPDYILVLAWNFFDVIKSSNTDLVDEGCKFITLKQLEAN
jgi:nucleoside-diphosphate-sugar epimerase/SAM-dependent methyltransferase/quercetin dioxygenase-like cupin family protein